MSFIINYGTKYLFLEFRACDKWLKCLCICGRLCLCESVCVFVCECVCASMDKYVCVYVRVCTCETD